MAIGTLDEEVLSLCEGAVSVEARDSEGFEILEEEEANEWANERDDKEDSFQQIKLEWSKWVHPALPLKRLQPLFVAGLGVL